MTQYEYTYDENGEPTLKLYGGVSVMGQPDYDDIMKSDLPREEKVKQIKLRGQAYRDKIDDQLHKDYARIGLGGLVSAIGALPIAITKNPVIGSAIGGGVYELGQGIMEGEEFPELMQRAGWGGAIGGTVGGAISKLPNAAKFVNNLSGGRIGNALKPIGEKIAQNPAVQKAYDVLMTDIKAFNPNKQTVYHGSPYDFEKFSNEAIGTGEGAQAHGLGHYAALDKDIADKNYRDRLIDGQNILDEEKSRINNIPFKNTPLNKLDEISKNELAFNKSRGFSYEKMLKNLENKIEHYQKQYEKFSKMDDYAGRAKLYKKTLDSDIEKYNILKENPFDFENTDLIMQPKQGQLYKLSVPKDDVMLREDLPFSEQPKAVQDALQKIANKQGEWGNKEYLNFWEIPEDEFYNQAIKGNATGKEIQNLINNYAKDNFAATSILRDNGIKGISYNGGIDGEARVIFNPDDIVIGRKYYNQPNLYQQLTGKQNTGALVDALLNR